MTDLPDRRIGDVERQATLDRLRDAYAQGALHTDELEDRMATAMSARFATELDGLVADLPAPRDGAAAPAPSTAEVTVEPARPPSGPGIGSWASSAIGVVVLALLAVGLGVTARGADVISIFGSTVTTASGEAGEELRVLVLFGSAEVVVQESQQVANDVTAIFGSNECEQVCTTTADPDVRISGLTLFGSVEIHD